MPDGSGRWLPRDALRGVREDLEEPLPIRRAAFGEKFSAQSGRFTIEKSCPESLKAGAQAGMPKIQKHQSILAIFIEGLNEEAARASTGLE